MIKYQEGQKKDMEMEKDWRRRKKSFEKGNVQSSQKPYEVAEGK